MRHPFVCFVFFFLLFNFLEQASPCSKKKWGTVAHFVYLNFLQIQMKLKESANDVSVFRFYEAQTSFSTSSIQKAYQQQVEKSISEPVTSKFHGNRTLTQFEESILIGYLLMRSDLGKAD